MQYAILAMAESCVNCGKRKKSNIGSHCMHCKPRVFSKKKDETNWVCPWCEFESDDRKYMETIHMPKHIGTMMALSATAE